MENGDEANGAFKEAKVQCYGDRNVFDLIRVMGIVTDIGVRVLINA